MTKTHLGILQDLRRRGFYKLEECGPWICDQLVEIIMLDGQPLITINDDYIVTLTAKGWEITANDIARTVRAMGDAPDLVERRALDIFPRSELVPRH